MLKYKDFIAQIKFIGRTSCFYGEVINKDCLIVLQAEHKKDLLDAFKTAVDQYLDYLQFLALEETSV